MLFVPDMQFEIVHLLFVGRKKCVLIYLWIALLAENSQNSYDE